MMPKYVASVLRRADKFTDLAGQRFGRLVAFAPVFRVGQRRTAHWVCVCDCGEAKIVQAQSLRKGGTLSCGCLHRERSSCAATKHGHGGRSNRSRTYMRWYAMKQRCTNPKNIGYERYGGRGISFDPRWDKFENFLADMGEAPEKSQLDRIDNDGNYEPRNCRWVTATENANNKSRNRYIEVNGSRSTVADFSRAHGMKAVAVRARLNRGWPPERLADPLLPSRWGRGEISSKGATP